MKLKYYLRGLGTGILFATIILFISYSYKMSDSQIKKMAEELGMVYAESDNASSEATTDKNNEDSSTTEPTTTKPEQNSSEETTTEEPTTTEPATEEPTTEEPTTTEPATEEPTTEEPTTPEPTTADANVEKCELTVTGSTSSNDVAYALASAGIIKDAEEFNNFLCDNGYDRKIQNGTYTITSDMSYEEIAKLITTRKY